ncbi:type II toxin-antitoxin system Phd/YefM family antitoxin [Anaerocolumna xylanovorans]|uniref:Antitoxin Phd n=1 Tax=Anaerocolumna xylanovorans DSM 12503 TaxID=1121345 RepID=A0A1M7XZ01_9FIRM|nr:type II toxin-antitoxin system Phd/YefM family antitoxin [Anaerocolumna xylanovorans]SHO44325.1 antitoxin Phd [Anaerocolumna xylanovorans DSM 12503]
MKVDLNNLISITEANQNFSKVARMVDENGAAVILKNNAPRYVIIDYTRLQEETIADNLTVEEAATKYLTKYAKAFEELAK